jgi:hypothetical protein
MRAALIGLLLMLPLVLGAGQDQPPLVTGATAFVTDDAATAAAGGLVEVGLGVPGDG